MCAPDEVSRRDAGSADGGPTDGGLPKDVIAQVVRSHTEAIRSCYEAALQNQPTLQGELTVYWIIGSDGAVTRQCVSEMTLTDPSVAACVLDQIATWHFPEPTGGGTVAVIFPYILRPKVAAPDAGT